MRDEVQKFLNELQDHALWQELLKEIEAPQVPRYRPGKKQNSQEAHDWWIYQSGRSYEYEKLQRILAGRPEEQSQED